MAENIVKVYEQVNKVVVSASGPQGPRGRTILNGTTAPSNSLGIEGDFSIPLQTSFMAQSSQMRLGREPM